MIFEYIPKGMYENAVRLYKLDPSCAYGNGVQDNCRLSQLNIPYSFFFSSLYSYMIMEIF